MTEFVWFLCLFFPRSQVRSNWKWKDVFDDGRHRPLRRSRYHPARPDVHLRLDPATRRRVQRHRAHQLPRGQPRRGGNTREAPSSVIRFSTDPPFQPRFLFAPLFVCRSTTTRVTTCSTRSTSTSRSRISRASPFWRATEVSSFAISANCRRRMSMRRSTSSSSATPIGQNQRRTQQRTNRTWRPKAMAKRDWMDSIDQADATCVSLLFSPVSSARRRPTTPPRAVTASS